MIFGYQGKWYDHVNEKLRDAIVYTGRAGFIYLWVLAAVVYLVLVFFSETTKEFIKKKNLNKEKKK